MRKTLSGMAVVAVSLFSAAGLVSCGDGDDDAEILLLTLQKAAETMRPRGTGVMEMEAMKMETRAMERKAIRVRTKR